MHPPRLSAVQKECLETGEFLCCHIVIDRAIHHMPRLLWLLVATNPSQNWIKWLAGSAERAPIPRIHLKDSHHSPLVILQWKKRCPASSCWQPQRGHIISWIGMLLLDKFPLVGSLSKNNLQEILTLQTWKPSPNLIHCDIYMPYHCKLDLYWFGHFPCLRPVLKQPTWDFPLSL